MVEKRPRNGIGWILLLWVIIFLVYGLGSALSQMLPFLLAPSISPSILVLLSGATAVLFISVTTAVLFFYQKFVVRRALVDIGLTNFLEALPKFILGLFIGIAGILLASAPLYLSKLYTLKFLGVSPLLLQSLFFFVLVGFGEEVLTRGVLQHGLLRLGPIPAVVITSLVFSLLHLLNPGITVFSLLNIFLAGMALGMLQYATKNIWASVGMHITWNWVQGNLLGIPVSGTDGGVSLFQTSIAPSKDFLTGGLFGLEGTLSCAVFLLLLTVLLYFIAKKNGGYAYYTALGKNQRDYTKTVKS